MNMRASLENFAFSHSKTAISFNILLVLQTPLSQKHTFSGLKLHLHTYSTTNAVSFYYLCMYGAIYTIYRQNTNIEKNMYMRASGASELRKISHFHILKLLFLSIFSWYTSDTLSVQMKCLSAHMYRRISKRTDKIRKSIIGGGGGGGSCPPAAPPPPLWLR